MIMVQILMVKLVALTKDDDDADNIGQCWSIIVIKLNKMNKQRVTNPLRRSAWKARHVFECFKIRKRRKNRSRSK